jgi:NADH:ubiquinone reductase (H+-translocating)
MQRAKRRLMQLPTEPPRRRFLRFFISSLNVPVAMIRDTFNRITGLGAATRALCMPWLLLIARIWFGQVVLVHQIMTMAEGGHAGAQFGSLHLPSGTDVAVRAVMPVLLSTGLLTRPIALVFLLETLWGHFGAMNASALGAKVALLGWLVVSGPGGLSFDSLLARGLRWIPFGALRAMRGLYGWLDRHAAPLAQLAIRLSLAMSLLACAAPMFSRAANMMFGESATALVCPAWFAVTIAVALAFGVGTRFAALSVAAMIPTMGIAMSMDDRLAVLLLLLVIVAAGAGALSVDRLLDMWMRVITRRKGPSHESLPHVVVVGGGFGGVAVVQGLSGLPCRVTLIDRRNHHLFQPLLYQVATAALSPAEVATPIRSLFRRQRNVRVQLGEVTGVDVVTREVLVGTDRTKFDYLVLATGARHSYFGKDGWAPFAPGLKSIEDATSIRSRLLRAFEEAENAVDEAERAAWMTFVIVGGGPTGIELAGAISELARHGMDDEYRTIDPADARVILLQSGPRVLPTFSPASSAAAQRALESLGVEVHLQSKVMSVDSAGVDVGGQRIPVRTVLWAAGVAASPAAQWLGRVTDPSGRVAVGADLSVAGAPGVFAIGDTASSLGWRGSPVPGLAPAAKQQGRYVAQAIGAALESRPAPPPFRYRHFGSLATIGRQAAVAELAGLRLWGAPAWWFWGAAHILFLVGGRNRMTVILDWTWAYLTYRRSTRLITGASSGES